MDKRCFNSPWVICPEQIRIGFFHENESEEIVNFSFNTLNFLQTTLRLNPVTWILDESLNVFKCLREMRTLFVLPI